MRSRRALVLAVAFALGACRREGISHEDRGHAGHAPSSAPLSSHAGHEGGDGGAPQGYAPVSLDRAQAAALGLRVVPIEERELARTVRTVGVVALDETRTSHVHAKVRGFVETLEVDFVGKKVSAGQPLCTLYSQEVHAAELEFLSVLDRARPANAPAPSGSGEFAAAEARAQEQLLEAARRRLALWDVPKAEIERLERTREAKRTFPLLAPRPGVVIEKQALAGMYVDPSAELFTVSDLARVWVLADLYEADVPFVHVGAKASLAIEGRSAPTAATVAFLPPTLDEATRTLKARFVLDNAAGDLRPGAFVDVTMDLGVSRGLVVPESAVLRTGTRSIVFVAHGAPESEGGSHLEPREVKLGPLLSGAYRVDAGLARGDLVAVGAQFLLDSESRLRASGSGGGHGGHGGH